MYYKRRQKGFTIVELLIVIVVIAILAAISIVAYNGIQQRANNTQTVDAIKQYIKALNMYGMENNDYPNTHGCLGENYPAPNNRCLSQDGTVACLGMGQATNLVTNNALKPYMNNKSAQPSMQQASCGGTSYVGVYYHYNSGDKSASIYGVLRGDQSCPFMSPNTSYQGSGKSGDLTLCHYRVGSASSL